MVPTESYLKFNIQFTSGADNNAFRWDSCGAHGVIQRIRIFHGSNLLQDIDQYGMLTKMLFDLQQPTDAIFGKQNILAGTRNDMVAFTPTAAAVADLSAKSVTVANINSGERILEADGGLDLIANAATTKTETYCLNLVSLVGSLCTSNYIPLFAMTSAPLRVELQLVPNVVNCCGALTGALTNSFLISNCEYIMNTIEIADSGMQTIYSSLGGEPLQFVVPDFRNYQFTQSIPNNTSTQVSLPIPAKFSSLKALFVTIRDKQTGGITFFPFSSVTSGCQEYQFRIGATVMPPKAPSTLPEMFAEVVKAIGSIGDVSYQPSIDKRTYIQATTAAYTEVATVNLTSGISSGSFYIGLDCENYAAASKDQIFAGINTNTDDTYCQITLLQATGNAVNTRFDAYANFDAVVVCENNTCYVKF